MQASVIANNPDIISTHIAEQGFCIVEHFLEASTVSALASEVQAFKKSATMQPAGIGREHRALNAEIRGDHIFWLDEAQASTAQQPYFQQMEQLRLSLNQHLYLGVFGLESIWQSTLQGHFINDIWTALPMPIRASRNVKSAVLCI